MCEVLRSNFEDLFPIIEDAIVSADFLGKNANSRRHCHREDVHEWFDLKFDLEKPGPMGLKSGPSRPGVANYHWCKSLNSGPRWCL